MPGVFPGVAEMSTMPVEHPYGFGRHIKLDGRTVCVGRHPSCMGRGGPPVPGDTTYIGPVPLSSDPFEQPFITADLWNNYARYYYDHARPTQHSAEMFLMLLDETGQTLSTMLHGERLGLVWWKAHQHGGGEWVAGPKKEWTDV